MSSVLKSPLQPTSRKPTECSNSSCTTCNKPSYLNANASAPRILARCGTREPDSPIDRKSTRLNSSHLVISYAVLSLKKKITLSCRNGAVRENLLRRIYYHEGKPTKSDFFFFNDTATTEIYTLSLHDALPI